MAFDIDGDGILQYQRRLYVLDVYGLQERILAEAYESYYVVHPSLMKLYHDLKEMYWSRNMKWDVANFMAKYMVCQ